MSPDVLSSLTPQAREALHHAAWVDAMVNPSLMPTVPSLPSSGYTAKDAADVMAVRKWRDALEAAFFPDDELDEEVTHS